MLYDLFEKVRKKNDMNNYNEVLKIAKDLQEEFGKKITVFESLQIAAQIQIAEALTNGLQTGVSNEPALLEAIAISLGFTAKNERVFSSTVADSLKSIASKE